jgi:hypothetical protein
VQSSTTEIDVPQEFIPFNLNSYVRVKLTDHGKEILARQAYPDFRDADANGLTKFQAWELFEYFAHNVHLGCDLPFETTIQIELEKS